MPETILLVEDDDSLRRLAQRQLARLGYRVMVAGNGEAALASCRDCPDPIALLITDVLMPDIRGPELAERLLGVRPDLKVLYVSGSSEAFREDGVLAPGSHFLQKPYTQEEMSRKIREILDGGSAGA
jgi:two-component system cell cycle sensor histidine kinase/response regulator CckA